jgi:mRNA interferase RelE/StbE
MSYKLVAKEEVEDDLSKLSHAQRVLVFKQFKKLQTSPELGKDLGNKAGYNLSGCKKLYVDKKKIRIVYRIVDNEILVEVIVVGKREDMEVYDKANKRINS